MKIKFPYHRFSVWVSGLTDIIEGLCKVISLGFWVPNLTLPILCWGMNKETEIRGCIEEEEIDPYEGDIH